MSAAMKTVGTTTLPSDPLEKLEVFGSEGFGTERWQASLARAAGVPHRSVKYWVSGYCPPNLDDLLIRAATNAIAEHHHRAAILRAFRDQLEVKVL